MLVNATETGSADKVVFEAMAAGRPVLTSSTAFAALLRPIDARLVFPAGDAEALSERIVELAGKTESSLQELGAELRARATAEHSLEHWAEAVTTLAGQGCRRGFPGVARWIRTGSSEDRSDLTANVDAARTPSSVAAITLSGCAVQSV